MWWILKLRCIEAQNNSIIIIIIWFIIVLYYKIYYNELGYLPVKLNAHDSWIVKQKKRFNWIELWLFSLI